ncbi:MAG: Crp/Fnr family transcriptional regulator [Hyphomicrobiaceae bacterium]|nr:Crp/Fnr family transcriptional regulator [Hyphomicrobiaceae bacterium]
MTSETTLETMLAQSHLFAGLEAVTRQALAKEMRRVSFDNGQLIFSRGDRSQELYLVTNGRVRLSILSAEGRELSFAHAAEGAVFGEIAMLDGSHRTADATAVGKVEAMVLGQAAFRRVLETSPDFAFAVIQFLCGRLREADLQLEGVALHRIEVRLARFLLGLCAQGASDNNGDGGMVTVDLGMSQSELALLLGASRPKVNGALMLLEEQGAVTRDGNKVRCDLEELRIIAELD